MKTYLEEIARDEEINDVHKCIKSTRITGWDLMVTAQITKILGKTPDVGESTIERARGKLLGPLLEPLIQRCCCGAIKLQIESNATFTWSLDR